MYDEVNDRDWQAATRYFRIAIRAGVIGIVYLVTLAWLGASFWNAFGAATIASMLFAIGAGRKTLEIISLALFAATTIELLPLAHWLREAAALVNQSYALAP